MKLEEKEEKLEKDMDILKVDVESLKYENKEIKNALNKIQTQDLSKNFLRVFKRYLSYEECMKIDNDVSEMGKIISEKIESEFEKYKGKSNFNLIINLIKKASNILNKGNNLAHSLTLDNFLEDIRKYKTKKKLHFLPYQEIFCFLVALGIPEKDFDNYYNLLKKYFTKHLVFKSRYYTLEKMFGWLLVLIAVILIKYFIIINSNNIKFN